MTAPAAAVIGWRRGRLAAALFAAIVLAACGTAPRSGGPVAAADTERDGAPANPPADLIDRPDPEPRVEAIRSGGPNKPYVVLGQAYTPVAADEPLVETGLASWYGRKFHGRPTASGEPYDMYAMSAAHRTMPIPSYALVRNPANGREVVVRINDRGPFHRERVIDLSYAAALKLGVLRGVTTVQVQRLTHDDIRSARWRGAPPTGPAEQAAAIAAVAPPAASAQVWPTDAAPTALEGTGPKAVATGDPPATGVADPSAPSTAQGFWVQLGAFRQRRGADALLQQLRRELDWLEPWLAVVADSAMYRLQAGPYASRIDAQGAAERIRAAASLQPLIVLRP